MGNVSKSHDIPFNTKFLCLSVLALTEPCLLGNFQIHPILSILIAINLHYISLPYLHPYVDQSCLNNVTLASVRHFRRRRQSLTSRARNRPGLTWVLSLYPSSPYQGPPHDGSPHHKDLGANTDFRQEAFSTITRSTFRVSALLLALTHLTLAGQ